MKIVLLAACLAAAPHARVHAASGSNGAFAVAYGASAYAVITDPNALDKRVIVRQLGFDGGVL